MLTFLALTPLVLSAVLSFVVVILTEETGVDVLSAADVVGSNDFGAKGRGTQAFAESISSNFLGITKNL